MLILRDTSGSMVDVGCVRSNIPSLLPHSVSSSVHRALLSVHRALLSVHRALLQHHESIVNVARVPSNILCCIPSIFATPFFKNTTRPVF